MTLRLLPPSKAVELAKVATQELTSARAAATAWSSSIVALIGVFGLVGITFGIDKLPDLVSWAKWTALIATVIALVTAAAALFVVISAAQRRAPLAANDPGLIANRNWKLADDIYKGIGLSRIYTGIALIALAAVGVASTLGKQPSFSQVTFADGSIRCGQLFTASDGTLTLNYTVPNSLQDERKSIQTTDGTVADVTACPTKDLIPNAQKAPKATSTSQ